MKEVYRKGRRNSSKEFFWRVLNYLTRKWNHHGEVIVDKCKEEPK